MLIEFFKHISSLELVIGILLIVLVLSIITIRYIYIYKLTKCKSVLSGSMHSVSLVIIAKNDAKFLENNLELFLNQAYENFEIIVVDDGSFDGTASLVAKYMQKYPILRLTSISPDKKFVHTKKLAINVGLKAAKNDIVIFTDANCYPCSKKWIDNIQSGFVEGVDIVISYANFVTNNSFLGKFIIYDRLCNFLRFSSFACFDKAIRGDFLNLAFRRNAFLNTNSYGGDALKEEGVDVLPIIKLRKSKNISIVVNKTSKIYVDYIDIKKEWIYYKTLYFKSVKYYSSSVKFLIGIIPSIFITTNIILLICFINTSYVLLLSGLILFYALSMYIYKRICLKMFDIKGMNFLIPIFEIYRSYSNLIYYFKVKK